jgi:hypothetical protein
MPTSDNTQSASLSPLARFSMRLISPAALYDDWLVAETKATIALEAWRTARSGAKPAAYATYVAALAYEEHAADLLAIRVRGPR